MRIFRLLKPDRDDVRRAAQDVRQSLVGQILKRVGIGAPSLDALGGKKLVKSGGLLGVTLLAVNLLVSAPWWPTAWTDPQSISAVTAGTAWTLNLVRKVFMRYAPTGLVEELT